MQQPGPKTRGTPKCIDITNKQHSNDGKQLIWNLSISVISIAIYDMYFACTIWIYVHFREDLEE